MKLTITKEITTVEKIEMSLEDIIKQQKNYTTWTSPITEDSLPTLEVTTNEHLATISILQGNNSPLKISFFRNQDFMVKNVVKMIKDWVSDYEGNRIEKELDVPKVMEEEIKKPLRPARQTIKLTEGDLND